MLRRFSLLLVATTAFALAVPSSALTIWEVGADGAPGEDGESVSASGVETAAGADPVEVEVRATGGDGGPATAEGDPAGDGGGASLGEVFGASETGPVSVSGAAEGGDGGMGSAEAPAGDGASVELRNAVDGETQGRLTLSQMAAGGDVRWSPGGVAGSARSVLRRRKSAESLQLRSSAIAGGPTIWVPGAQVAGGGDGAPARAVGQAANDAGGVTSLVLALGGSGGIPDLEAAGAPGGDARVVAIATSKGDGQPVRVGVAPPLYPPRPPPLNPIDDVPVREFALWEASPERAAAELVGFLPHRDLDIVPYIPLYRGARAGHGGDFSIFSAEPTPPGGRGGAAHSLSIGIAHGDSPVEVVDDAWGGAGGRQANLGDASASRGGPANSRAIGLNGGDSLVEVSANAAGGSAGMVGIGLAENPFPLPDPSSYDPDFVLPGAVPGGDAEARALASGGGEVGARASAKGGSSTVVSRYSRVPRHPGGQGRASATAVGASGEVEAAAASNTPTLRVELRAGASVVQMATADSRIGPGPLRGRHGHHRHGPRRDASAQASVAPDEAAVDRALASDPALCQALEAAGGDEVVVLGRLAASQQQWTRHGSVVSTLEVRLGSIFFSDPVDEALIALFAPRVQRRGFERLHVRLTKEDEVLADELFESASDARDFLAGALFEVGPLGAVSEGTLGRFSRSEIATLTLELETRRRGAGLDVSFLVGTALLPASSQR